MQFRGIKFLSSLWLCGSMTCNNFWTVRDGDYIWHAYLTYETLSNDEVNDLMSLTFTLKIAVWNSFPPGAFVSYKHILFFMNSEAENSGFNLPMICRLEIMRIADEHYWLLRAKVKVAMDRFWIRFVNIIDSIITCVTFHPCCPLTFIVLKVKDQVLNPHGSKVCRQPQTFPPLHMMIFSCLCCNRTCYC